MNYLTLLLIAAAGYLLASVFYGAYMLKTKHRQQIAFLHAGRLSGVIGILSHTAAIGLHCMQSHHTPISTGPEAFSATGWAVAIVYLGVEILNWKKPPTAVGAAAFPIAFLSLFTGSVFGAPHSQASVQHTALLDNPIVGLHILAIIFSYGLLALAACCAAFYLTEHRLLKQKKVMAGWLAKLPPLATVDHLTFTLVSLAFPLLTLGIVAGIIRAATSTVPIIQWLFDAETLTSTVCWALYAVYIWAHTTSSLHGTRSNYLLIAGLAIALITFFVPTHLHRFS